MYGLVSPDDQEPFLNYAAIVRANSATLETLLSQRSVTPPGTQDLTALTGRVGTLETNVTALQAGAYTVGAWANVPWVGGTTNINHDPGAGQPKCQYRREGARVVLRGWCVVGSAGVATGVAVSAALPAEVRPAQGIDVWLFSQTASPTLKRLTLGTDGILRATWDSLPANTYYNLAFCYWPLG
jgi:hypothetical protein